MAASYPAGFDTMSDPSTNLSGPPLHSTMHNQVNDVLEAIEAELGLNPSGADATVAATLAALASRYASITRHGGSWRRAAVQSIASGVYTAIAWDTEVADTDAYAVPTWTIWTCPVGLGGIYSFTVQAIYSIALNANSIRFVVSSIVDPFEVPGVATISFTQTASISVPIAAGDTVTFQTLHTNGGAQNIARARLDIYKWPCA